MIGLVCEICGHKEQKNLRNHLSEVHNMSTKEYRKQYRSKTMTGHSKRTVDYWLNLGYSYEDSVEKVKEFQRSSKKRFLEKCKAEKNITDDEALEYWKIIGRTSSPRSILYYTSKGYSEEEALKMRSEYQASSSKLSSKFSGHNHTPESRKKISDTMKKRVQEAGPEIVANRFYMNREGIRSGGEIQCFLLLKQIHENLEANKPIMSYVVDMVDEKYKIVIEYFGDFWHRNPEIYEKEFVKYGYSSEFIWNKDSRRRDDLQNNGYTVFTIWEKDWHKHKEEVIQNLKRLYESKS